MQGKLGSGGFTAKLIYTTAAEPQPTPPLATPPTLATLPAGPPLPPPVSPVPRMPSASEQANPPTSPVAPLPGALRSSSRATAIPVLSFVSVTFRLPSRTVRWPSAPSPRARLRFPRFNPPPPPNGREPSSNLWVSQSSPVSSSGAFPPPRAFPRRRGISSLSSSALSSASSPTYVPVLSLLFSGQNISRLNPVCC